MRTSYFLFILVAFDIAGYALLSAAILSETKIRKNIPVQESDKRSMHSYNMNDLKNDEEERMIRLDKMNIEEALQTEKIGWVLHPDRIDEIFSGLKDGKILGKIDRSIFDSIHGSNSAYYNKVFAQWMEDGVSAAELTKFVYSNQALKNKYKWVTTMYEGFVNRKK